MGDKSSTRRRFLAGSVSLPVIMTVQSGSALANGSVADFDIRCAVDNAQAPAANLTTTASDEWVRVAITLVTLTVDDVAYTSPSGIKIFFSNLNNTAYYQYLGDDVLPVLLTGQGVPAPNQLNVKPTAVIGGTRYALVADDVTGQPVGFAWESVTGAQKLTGSCWSSFAAA